MDIGKVDQKAGYEDDVAAVSAHTQRHGRGGWSHLRRDCPPVTAGKGVRGKGKGKGPNPQSGKGGPPSWGKAAGKGGKGGTKGSFKGACFLSKETKAEKKLRKFMLEESGTSGP